MSTGTLSLDTAVLAASFTSCILYGIFTVLYFTTIYVLIYKQSTGRPHLPFIGMVTTMMVLITVNLALSFSRTMDGFIYYVNTPGGALSYFVDLSAWKEVARSVVFCMMLLLADGILIYRCWVVWLYKWKIIVLPVLSWCVVFAMAGVLMYNFTRNDNNAGIFADNIARWIDISISFALAENIVVTGLIVFRIWRIDQAVTGHKTRSLMPIMALIIESGSMYASTLLIYLLTYWTGNNAQWIVIDVIPPMAGITFSLLIVRVGLGLTNNPSRPTYFRSGASSSQPQPISITVRRQTDRDDMTVSRDGMATRSNSDIPLDIMRKDSISSV